MMENRVRQECHLDICGNAVPIYDVTDVQKQWSALMLFPLLFKEGNMLRADYKKRFLKMRHSLASIHELVFPTFPVPDPLPVKARVDAPGVLAETTMDTSLVLCSFLWAMNPLRLPENRHAASDCIGDVVKLFVLKRSFQIWNLGDHQWRHVEINEHGCVPRGEFLWGQTPLSDVLRSEWEADLVSGECAWISSPFSSPRFADLVCFMAARLDSDLPQHATLRISGTNLLQQLWQIMEKNTMTLGADRPSRIPTKKKCSPAEIHAQLQKVRSGEVVMISSALPRTKAQPSAIALREMVAYSQRTFVEFQNQSTFWFYMDGSAVAKIPTELFLVYSPWQHLASMAPPLAVSKHLIDAKAEELKLDGSGMNAKQVRRTIKNLAAVLVMLKAVNQSNWNVLHKDLSMYEPVRMLQLGEDLKLEPPLSQDRPLLKAVADGETSGVKAFKLAACKLRVWWKQDDAHPSWNDVRNSYVRAGLGVVVLKATVLANAGHGPYLGGSNALTRDIACAKYIEKHRHNEQHWMELAEAIAQDRGSDLLTDDVPSHLESWSSEESMTHRGEYVKNKSWFGFTRRCRSLVRDWTVCSEIYHFAVHDLDNDKEPAEEAEAEEQEEAENGEEEEHPETKQQWNEFRKKHKNLHLVDLLYSDRHLQSLIRLCGVCSEPAAKAACDGLLGLHQARGLRPFCKLFTCCTLRSLLRT
ncbi:unnamed protein product [Effrenium voratum]|nr:unnamed protein product [Effrenium voratum]